MDQGETHQWVVGRRSAREATRALQAMTWRKKRVWIVLGVMWAAYGTWLTVASRHDDTSVAFRLAMSFGVATVFVALFVPVFRTINRFLLRRSLAAQMKEGAVMTSSFGSSAVTLTGPHFRTELTYDAFTWTARHDDWFFFRHGGSKIVQVSHGTLFPEHEVGRIRLADGARALG